MKTLLATVFGLALLGGAQPASAYLVAVATSFEATGIADRASLEAAIATAIDDVLSGAIAFSPTFVTLQNSRIVGNRVYIVLLIGDRDGEETLKRLSGEDPET
jgi:hypothetical protein